MKVNKVIDCHTHIANSKSLEDYKRELNCEAYLCIKFFNGFANGEFNELVNSFDEFIVNTPNAYAIEVVDITKDIDIQLKNIEKNLHCNKIRGLKIYTGYQFVYPTDKILWPVYEFCNDYKLPLVYHEGALLEYPHSKAVFKYTHPILVDEIATLFPNVNFIISHFAFPYLMETAIILSKNDNVYTDFSGLFESNCKNLFEAYSLDFQRVFQYYPDIYLKIMFGTDFISSNSSLNDIKPYIELVEKVVPEKYHLDVFYNTAKKLYKI